MITRPQGTAEHNDCTVIALANAAGLDYNAAHGLLTNGGRRVGRRFDMHGWLKHQWLYAGKINGFSLCEKAVYFKMATIADFAKKYPRGRFIVIVRGHALAVVDGVVLDSVKRTTRRVVIQAWELYIR